MSKDAMLERQADMQDKRLFEAIYVACCALILDQAGIRSGEFRAVGMTLMDHVCILLDDDVTILFTANEARRDQHGTTDRLAIVPIVESPQIGDAFSLAGFPATNNRLEIVKEVDEKRFSLGMGLVVSEGEITDVHEGGRDARQCFYPCFATNAQMGSGHSGGPAICKDKWGVVGINSAGLENEKYSVLSWLGKSVDVKFQLPFTLNIPSGDVPAMTDLSLRTLAERQVINII